MTRTYVPEGAIVKLLAAMKCEPEREFTSIEAAKIMGCHLFSVTARIEAALKAKLLFRRSFGRGRPALLRGTPFPPGTAGSPECQRWKEGREVGSGAWATKRDDLRIPKVVPGWTPPKMVCTRGGV